MKKAEVKISVIGAGFVGSTSVYAIMMKNLASEIVIVDLNKDKANAEALDIGHVTSLVGDIKVIDGDYQDTRDSDIVVITAGVGPKYGETRIDVLDKNLEIYKSIIPEVVMYSPNSVLLVVSNPVDILTYLAYKLSGFPRERVLGSGTVIDTSRLKYLIGVNFNIKAVDINTFVLGEHGDSQVALWSQTKVKDKCIEDYCKEIGLILSDDDKNSISETTKQVGFDIVHGKGYTNYGIGLSVAEIVEAIVKDTNEVLPISTLYNGEYGIEDVYMAAPCVVGKGGMKNVIELNICNKEINQLKNSAEVLKKLIVESGI